jgi:hypothetical protein
MLAVAPVTGSPTPLTTHNQAPAAELRKEPLSVWRPAPGDVFEHLQSGLSCPGDVKGFRRTGVATYDDFGLDVSCGYNSQTAAITLYLTRRGSSSDAFSGAKQSLEETWRARAPRVLADGPVTLDGREWLRAEYELIGGGMRTAIWVTDQHGWVLKFRATYPATSSQEVTAEIKALSAQARSSAGVHLERCGKSKAPARLGKNVRSGRSAGLNTSMASLLGGVAAASAQGKAVASVPMTFCVEEPVWQEGMNLLAWRGVTPEGEDARIDRVTGMTVTPPPALDIAFDETGSLVTAELTGKARELWVATLTQDRQVIIVAYFDGRPPFKLTSDLMGRIAAGKVKALGSYSLDGKTVNVTVPK